MLVIKVIRVCRCGREETMNVVRLARHQLPRPPHHELRQKRVFDSRGRITGTVENLYVEEDSRQLHFVDVVTSGLLGLGRKHHLVPVEAVSEEGPGSITLGVDQEIVERAPTFPNPRVGADEEYQRTIREHYGYS
jgi:sporulation protein YlmC with PRC-barrel domain